ncbi:MAG: hypothetical protein GY906_23780 [bacterium]|nr:hypothetical protein [bacterium]
MTYYLIIIALSFVNLYFLLRFIRLMLRYKRQRDVLYDWIGEENWKWDLYPDEYCDVIDEIIDEKF